MKIGPAVRTPTLNFEWSPPEKGVVDGLVPRFELDTPGSTSEAPIGLIKKTSTRRPPQDYLIVIQQDQDRAWTCSRCCSRAAQSFVSRLQGAKFNHSRQAAFDLMAGLQLQLLDGGHGKRFTALLPQGHRRAIEQESRDINRTPHGTALHLQKWIPLSQLPCTNYRCIFLRTCSMPTAVVPTAGDYCSTALIPPPIDDRARIWMTSPIRRQNGLMPIEVACKHGHSHVISCLREVHDAPTIHFDTHHLSLHPSYITHFPLRF